MAQVPRGLVAGELLELLLQMKEVTRQLMHPLKDPCLERPEARREWSGGWVVMQESRRRRRVGLDEAVDEALLHPHPLKASELNES